MGLTQEALEGVSYCTQLLSLPPHFSHGSKPRCYKIEYGAQEGLWSGEPNLPPLCFLTTLNKNSRWSCCWSTGQG